VGKWEISWFGLTNNWWKFLLRRPIYLRS